MSGLCLVYFIGIRITHLFLCLQALFNFTETWYRIEFVIAGGRCLSLILCFAKFCLKCCTGLTNVLLLCPS